MLGGGGGGCNGCSGEVLATAVDEGGTEDEPDATESVQLSVCSCQCVTVDGERAAGGRDSKADTGKGSGGSDGERRSASVKLSMCNCRREAGSGGSDSKADTGKGGGGSDGKRRSASV
jgi:hypothetical protein